MNTNKLIKKINTVWDEEIIPTLIKYIEIPNKSHEIIFGKYNIITNVCKQKMCTFTIFNCF